MNKLAIIAIMLVLSNTVLGDPPKNSGDVACDRATHGGPCHLSWNVTDNLRAYHKVQWFDTAVDSWRDHDGRVIEYAYHTQESAVPGGRLYRVLSCNDPDMQSSCVGSNVTWVIMRPESVDEIPEYFVDSKGNRMRVSKNLNLLEQTIQYNVYLVVQYAENIDELASMPPMTKPSEPNPHSLLHAEPLTADDEIYLNVYTTYENLRTNALQAKNQQ